MQTARMIDTDGLSDNAIYLRNEIKSVVKTRLGLEASGDTRPSTYFWIAALIYCRKLRQIEGFNAKC